MKPSIEYSDSVVGLNEFCRGIALPASLRAGDDLCTETSAALLRVDQGLYRFQSAIPFAPDARIQITLESCVFAGEVICCHELSSSVFLLVIRRTYKPRRALRTEPRISVNLWADLRSPSADRMFVRIVDMSRSGLGLDELSSEIKEGTRVSVHFDAGVAFGEIRHCSPSRKGGFRAGVQISDFLARVREAESDKERRAAYPGAPERRFDAYVQYLARTLRCAVSGHNYRWVADSWERAALKCGRCQRELEQSFFH
jgi:PilZ domain